MREKIHKRGKRPGAGATCLAACLFLILSGTGGIRVSAAAVPEQSAGIIQAAAAVRGTWPEECASAVTGQVEWLKGNAPASAARTESSGDSEEPVRMDYYYFNTCSACTPEEEFYEIVREEIGDLRGEYPIVIQEHNTFQSGARADFQKMEEALGLTDLPSESEVLVIGDQALVGRDQISRNLRAFFLEQVGVGAEVRTEPETGSPPAESASSPEIQTPSSAGFEGVSDLWNDEISDSDSVLWLFTTLSCTDCGRVYRLLDQIGDTVTLADGSVSRVVVKETNITEENNVAVLYALFDTYGVPDSSQQVPALFYQDGWLTGADDIEQNLEKDLRAGQMQHLDPARFREAAAQSTAAGESSVQNPPNPLSLILTGLVNGLNPCGASMLLMLLAGVIAVGGKILMTGLSYLAGKMAAYFAMGFGLYRLLQMIDTAFLSGLSRVLSWIFAGIFLVLAVLYVIDFVHVRREEYGKERMQLPQGLRRWNRKLIQRAASARASRLVPVCFALGVVVSAGEFFCTGQVYLAEILYLMRSGTGHAQAVLSFILYVTAMCVPSLLLVLVVAKTGSTVRASNTSLQALPAIKLLTAIVFAVFAVLMLFLR